MKKINIQQGDIYEVPLGNGMKTFLQFVYSDEHNLGGHLVRIFDYEIDEKQNVNIENLYKCRIRFFEYTVVDLGVELGFWYKIGNMKIEDNFEEPLFKYCGDHQDVEKSYNWYLVKGDKTTKIGELPTEYKNLSDTSIKPPKTLIYKLLTSNYNYRVPN